MVMLMLMLRLMLRLRLRRCLEDVILAVSYNIV